MGPKETGLGDKAAVGGRMMRATGMIALVALLALGVCASTASAGPLSMTFTEARANVGVQLDDAALFEAPNTAPFAAQIDPGNGLITGGVLQVPQFFTHITTPINADVSVDFDIGEISGSFGQATGALSLTGTAGGTLTATNNPTYEGEECTVSTVPSPLTLTTGGNSGGTSPRSGAPFIHGLTGPGAIAGQWTNMDATPVRPADTDNVNFCNNVETRIGGSGGVWLEQEGDVVPPSAPQLTSTDPASPGSSGTPRILGAAEAGSTVRVYVGPNCTGTPVATASAAKLGSPGIPVEVAEGVTAAFSATATDATTNTSACSAPISYTRLKAPPPPPPPPPPQAPAPPTPPQCIVPKLVGKTLQAAKQRIKAAGCAVGKVTKAKGEEGKKAGPLVVKSSKPSAGKTLEVGSEVNLWLGPKPRKARR